MKWRIIHGKWLALSVAMLAIVGMAGLIAHIAATGLPTHQSDSVFAKPRLLREAGILQRQTTEAFRTGDYQQAESLSRLLISRMPKAPSAYYNLACAQARKGQSEKAIRNLKTSIALGFRNVSHLEQDDDLASLRRHSTWKELLRLAAAPKIKPAASRATPSSIQKNVAMVDEKNTTWNAVRNQFDVLVDVSTAQQKTHTLIVTDDGDDEVAHLVNEWNRQGTAAGLSSVLYDNHDRDHSNIAFKRFPTLTRIEYSNPAIKEGFDNGLQHQFRFNAITLGNSSTSIVDGPFWRSQPRLAYSNPNTVNMLASQYFGNHLYVYPEHRDYDVERNGNGGFGDVYVANTPYLLISQGSSYSDVPFLNAITATLAAFRPDVLQKLAAEGRVFPCVQMILRRCLKPIKTDADYLSGIAHPPVFDGQLLDPLRMVQMAHDMTIADYAPIAILRVLKEDQPVVGRDYFDVGPREALFTSPAAISRICRSMHQTRRMTIDASGSFDDNGQPLSWHWIILQGDAERIKISPHNEAGSVATVAVQHHERRPIRPGSKIESSRVDIGVFVHNGSYFSAPAIISFYWPEDEKRTYDDNGRIQSVEYTDLVSGGTYVDPIIVTPKQWKDEYLYSDSGAMLGWIRIRGDSQERFTSNGDLVMAVDDQGRVQKTQSVRYVSEARPGLAPILKQILADSPSKNTQSPGVEKH